jgi:hypothetical protein
MDEFHESKFKKPFKTLGNRMRINADQADLRGSK